MKGVESKSQGEKSLQPQDAILYRMQTHGITRKNNIYDKTNHELELAAHYNIPVHARPRRRRNEQLMVVLEENKDNNPSTSFASKCVPDKDLRLGGVMRHFHPRCGAAAASVEKEVRTASSEHRRYLVDNVKRYSPSKFLKPILNQPVHITHRVNKMKSEGETTTCIILAAQLDDAETIQRLATAGADLNLTDRLGHSALTWAIILNHRDAAMALITCGANIEVIIIISKQPLLIPLLNVLLHLKGDPYIAGSS